ncbi:hypothetical protein R5R35_004312 [Gryllus longicercus]|uniref:LYR motif-containing protein 9 n=1 Tax=Gryllus longicercus TaxID=2509291 RepID=A0AAN9VM20_9ORTH
MVLLSHVLRTSTQYTPKSLYKYLLRQCDKLPSDAAQHYKHAIKQSYKQHILETDQQRVQQIIKRAVEDAEWVIKKYTEKNRG